MKTLDEIKNEAAVKHGYTSWNWLPDSNKARCVDFIAQEHAKQVAEAQRDKIANRLKYSCEYCGYEHKSIEIALDTELVTDNI